VNELTFRRLDLSYLPTLLPSDLQQSTNPTRTVNVDYMIDREDGSL